MSHQLLDYFAHTHSGYLHARGKTATHKLVELLDCQANENILEIGCGTGATLVQMAATYPTSKFQGVDVSETMLRFAHRRLKFCGLADQVQLSLASPAQPLPFEKHTFDRIYVESVIAIKEGEGLVTMLRECHRVLKPGGTLVFNETIWLDSTSQARAQEINEACKIAFGIIQANAEYQHVSDWKELLTGLGLIPQQVVRVADIDENTKPKSPFLPVFLSRIYSGNGTLKSRLNRELRKDWKQYQEKMKEIIPGNSPLMEGVIFRVVKGG